LNVVPLLFRHVQEAAAGVRSRIIDQDVDAAEAFEGPIYGGLDCFGASDVARERVGRAALFSDGGRYGFGGFAVDVEEVDLTALGCKQPGDAFADSGGSTGDDCDFVL
jgi:hypothetical protein